MTLRERLARGDVVVLDGGVSTAVEQRGVAMDRDVWSGTVHLTHPDVVRDVHVAYLEAGAEVITANTFASAPHVLASKGIGPREADEVNRAAVRLAREARDAAASGEAWVAGSMSSTPAFASGASIALGEGVAESYRRQAEALAEAGSDLILAEMMGDLENTALVLDAARRTGLPLFVGFSAALGPGGEVIAFQSEVREPAPPTELGLIVEAALAGGAQAAGIMHSELAATGPALDVVRERWDGPLLAYAETGRFLNPAWDFSGAAGPAAYADAAEGWVRDHGATIVGGCCGTGPEHVRALAERLRA